VETEAGSGTTFKIFLPVLMRSAESGGNSKLMPIGKNGGGTILLVEDEPGLRTVATAILRRAGYQLLTAGSGPEALKVMTDTEAHVDLLLTDMVMPDGMSGRELAEHLRAQRSDLKVLFTSGYTSELSDTSFRVRNGIRFLPKPYDAQTLCDAVSCCLKHEQPTVQTAS
jgi:CheY-like chemotaxis protein